jgi:hypothetical protein
MAEGEFRRLETLHSFRILNTAPEQSFDDLARLATLMCDTPVAVIDFVDEHRVWFKAKIGLASDEIPRERSFSTHAIMQSGVLIVADPVSDPLLAGAILGSRHFFPLSKNCSSQKDNR